MMNVQTELVGQATLVACSRALARGSRGARVVRTASSVAAVFPAWVPLNNAIVDSAGAITPDTVEELRTLYAREHVPWALWVPSAARDFDSPDQVECIPTLVRDTTTLVMAAPIVRAWRRHPAVMPASIGMIGTFGDEPLSLDELGAPETTQGLNAWAYIHDECIVSCAYSYLHGTDCGIYAVGTVPRWRRRGFATAVLEHVLAGAAARGARTASLQSTVMGQPLYASLGFEAVGRYEEWVPA